MATPVGRRAALPGPGLMPSVEIRETSQMGLLRLVLSRELCSSSESLYQTLNSPVVLPISLSQTRLRHLLCDWAAGDTHSLLCPRLPVK